MIIGITGTLGAGKGTIVEYLITNGFYHYSVRGFLNEEMAKRGLTSNRDTMVAIANDLRARYGSGYITEQLMGTALQEGGNAVIESIRTVGEARYLKSQGAQLWAVDADVRTRYERIMKRASETDSVSFEKFVQDEKTEWQNTDPSKQNLQAVMAMADTIFHNDGTKEELFAQVEKVLNPLI